MTIVCLAAALWGLDLKEVSESFSRLDFTLLPLILALLFLYFWLKAIRWRLLLVPLREFRTQEIIPPLMIGFMGNNVLPAHLGELIRVFVLGHEFSLSKVAVLSSVVLERIFDTLVILIFVGIGLFTVKGLPPWVNTGALSVAALTTSFSVLLIAYVFRTRTFLQIYHRNFRFLPTKLFNRIDEILESATPGLTSIKRPRAAFWIILTSLLQWTLMGGMVYVSLASLGLWLNPLASIVTIGVAALGAAIPSTPGYFGVIQLSFWVSLQMFGVEKADAFASSVYFHLSQYIPVTLVGLFYVNQTGLRLKQIKEKVTREKEESEIVVGKSLFDQAIQAFDAIHREDPKTIVVAGEEISWSLHYHKRLTHWVSHLNPDASEALLLAARCQHIRRWRIPRDGFPMERSGYKQWRKTLAQFHAEEAGRVLHEIGYDKETLNRLAELLQKFQLKRDPEVQLFEDAICLVFLENEFSDFSQKHDEGKLITIIEKTWKKMSSQGHQTALELMGQLPEKAQALIRKAVGTRNG